VGRARRAVGSIRARSTILATIVVLAALVLGSFVILNLYEQQLVNNLDNTLEQQVADRVQLLENGGSKEALTTVLQREAFVWIGSPGGEVTAQGGGLFPVDNQFPDVVGGTRTVDLLIEERKSTETELETKQLRITSAEASTGQVVLAGAELDVIDNTIAELASLFLIAVPILTALVGALAWLVVGRALHPVAAIQAQAESISGTTLTERVPVANTHDEVQDLATTVNAMLERIERHDLAIRQFSSDASHELKSPIANIKAMVETRRSADPSWPAVQDTLTRETERLGDLVDNLLFLATHQDQRPRSRSVVALDELVFAEAELLSATTDLRVDLSTVEPASVLGSPGDLARLTRNLVDNAARHAREKVRFTLGSFDGTTTLVVSDDGAGVPVEQRATVFERFTRLDEARDRDAGGTGLGLSIVAQIAEAHGAQVHVGDAELGGAAFSVVFDASPTSY